MEALTHSIVGLVVAGAGVSGAAVARPLSYAAAAALGAGLVFATGRRRRARRPRRSGSRPQPRRARARAPAGASTVGLVWTAVVPVQAILIAAISGAPAAGSLGAEVRLLTPIASISVIAALVYAAAGRGRRPRRSTARRAGR